MKQEKDILPDKEGLTVIDTDDGSDVSDDISLDTFKAESDGKEKDGKKKAGLKKKLLIALIAVAVLAVAFIIVYFTVIKPIFDEKQEEESALATPIPMIDGEVRDANNISVLLYEQVSTEAVKRITVTDPTPISGGSFNLVCDENGEFYVEEHKHAPVTRQTALNVINAAGYTVITERIEDNSCTELSRYGLAPENYPRQVVVEDTSGNKNIFYIGARIPTQGGYYCREEGRNAVYIINNTTLSPIIATSESLIQPILGPVLDINTAMMMDYFVLNKNGQRYISIAYDATTSETLKKSSYKMTFPTDYLVNDDRYGEVLTTVGALEGYMVVAAGDGTAEGRLYNNAAKMAQFGFYDLDNPEFEVYYEIGDQASDIIFAESGIDGYYYAYSIYWDTVVLIEKSTVDFLTWDTLEYVNRNIFSESIKDISSLTVSGTNVYYGGYHYNIDEKFSYWYDENGTLNSRAESTGSFSNSNDVKKNYMQAFYLVALNIQIQGYISEEEVNFDMENATEYARFSIKYNDTYVDGALVEGKTRTYVFYQFAGYCYFTVDGYGDFYVNTKDVNRLLAQATRAGLDPEKYSFDWQEKSPEIPEDYRGRID